MRLLLVHQNFPGQFRDLAPAFVERGHTVLALGNREVQAAAEGLDFLTYAYTEMHPEGCLDPFLENSIRRAASVAAAAAELKSQGYEPEVAIVHSGWGEALHLRSIWPRCRWIVYPEIYGSPACLGYGFDRPITLLSIEEQQRIDRQNLLAAAALGIGHAAVVPTQFQRSTFPPHLRHLIRVIHEGVDMNRISSIQQNCLTLPDGTLLTSDTPLLSFCCRSLEPLRGAHVFLKALPALLQAHATAHVVIVGTLKNLYGTSLPGEETSIPFLLQQLLTSPLGKRIHWVECLSHLDLLSLFKLSSAHTYLSYPYALSWSLLEAMACGSPVVGSCSAPVEEVIENHRNGILVPFSQPGALAAALLELLLNPNKASALGSAARRTVEERFSLRQAVLSYEALFSELLDQRTTNRDAPETGGAIPASRQGQADATT
ncbi:MAG: glycosyltransferase [Cyanobium sp.]|jgi:glycosyltransferase involved in cell wall biosynthesis